MNDNVDSVIIKVLVVNSTDVTLSNEPHFKNKVIQPGSSAMECLAEHGLALSITILKKNAKHHYLFDIGGLKRTILNNLKVFKIPPARFEKVIISHGHWDHWGAILEISQQLSQGTEFIFNAEGLHPRYSLKKDLAGTTIDLTQFDFERLKKEKKIRKLPSFPEKEFQNLVKEKNFILNCSNQPFNIESGITTSGEIRIFDPQEVTKGKLIKKNDIFAHDTFRDELSIYVNIKDKGLVIITGCGHCGLINTIKHGQELTGIDNVYAVIGGLHQNTAPLRQIKKTIQLLKDLNPTIVCGFHCTGFKFITEAMAQMPLQTALAVVGTTFLL